MGEKTITTDRVYPESVATRRTMSATTKKPLATNNGGRGMSSTAGTDNGGSSGTGAPVSGSVMIGSKPSLITVGPMKFLIMDAPRQANLHLYIKEMKKQTVKDVVRVCEPTYLPTALESAGMSLHEMEYPDGHSPSPQLINEWLTLVYNTFYNKKNTESSSSSSSSCIAVHCIAGLGRAPVMVAIALIEFEKKDPVEAVSLIRKHRRGAINEKQLIYLEGYKKQWKGLNGSGRSSTKGGGTEQSACCIIL